MFFLTLVLVLGLTIPLSGLHKRYVNSYSKSSVALLVGSFVQSFSFFYLLPKNGFWISAPIVAALVASFIRFRQNYTLRNQDIPYRLIRVSASMFFVMSFTPLLVGMRWLSLRHSTGEYGPTWFSVLLLWVVGICCIVEASNVTYLIKKVEKKLEEIAYLNYKGLINYVLKEKQGNDKKGKGKKDVENNTNTDKSNVEKGKKDDDGKREKLETLRFVVDRLISEGDLMSMKLGGEEYLFKPDFWESLDEHASNTFASEKRLLSKKFYSRMEEKITLPEDTIDELVLNLSHPAFKYDFVDGVYFVDARSSGNVRVCSSCGMAQWYEDETDLPEEEYFCSDLCRETAQTCKKIAERVRGIKLVDFATKAAANGIIVAGNALFWGRNVKMVSPDTQGHGFAAEDANTYLDRLMGRKATVVGNDNVANGPDRAVDGTLIQTKYCVTASRSVSAAFGEDGLYRYVDTDGKLMQLEVPSDQYYEALKIMEQKIAEGKVPGCTDVSKASELVRKGNISYETSVAITKFGTVESLMFDSARGVVVGLSAGGVSFAISSAITYWRTKDMKLALRSSILLGLKAGGVSTLSFIGAQQLQRIPSVTAFLDKAININFGGHGNFIRNWLGRGLHKMGGGRGNVNKTANATIKSATAVAAVTIAVTSSFEMLKYARGRISGWQCWKNIVQGAGGVTGGTVGALIGGVLLSPIPIVGTVLGSLVGGAIGGKIGTSGAKAVMNRYGDDDSVAIIKLISHQIEYLMRLYCLNEEEIDTVSVRIDEAMKAHNALIEDIFEKGCHKRQYVNSIVHPLFVEVVAARKSISTEDLSCDAICSELQQLAS